MVLLTPISTGVIAFEAGPNIAANPNCCGSATANYAVRIVTGDGACQHAHRKAYKTFL